MAAEPSRPELQPVAAPGTLLATKLVLPQLRADLVARERVRALLDRGLQQGHHLFLLSAPAGAGKTTLLADWLRATQIRARRAQSNGGAELPGLGGDQLPLRVSWLSLDTGDNDPQRFFAYLVAALRQSDAQLGAATTSLLGGPGLPTIESLVVPLLNDLAATAAPLALVLDDYHVIDNQVVHAAIALLVEHLPAQLYLFIATRADPPLPLPRLRARSQLTEVRAAELRFTAEETATFFARTMPLPLDAEAVRTLAEHTEGWVTGLQLAALSLRDRSAAETAAFVERFGASSQYVVDYLVDEVLSRQPPHRKAFLLQTAILDRMCGPLCDAVLGLTDGGQPVGAASYSGRLLAELEQANLFLVPLDPQRSWYRYSHLFADVLRAQLAAEPQLQTTLHQRAAQWFAVHELWHEAVQHALTAGDQFLAARLIGQAGDQLLQRGEVLTLQRWLAALTPAVVQADPLLMTLHAWIAYIRGDLEQSARLCDQLAALPADRLDPRSRGRFLSLQAFRSNAAESEATVALAHEALAGLDEDILFRQIALLTLGHGQRRAGATSAASATYRAALELSRNRQAPYVALNLLNSLVANLNEQGLRLEALQLCAAARDEWSDGQGRPLPILDLLAVGEGVLAYEVNELELAREHAEHGWEAVQRWISERIVGVDTERVYVLAALGLGDFEAARRRIAMDRAVASSLRWFGPEIDALEAELWLRQGDVASAARWARAAGFTPEGAPNAMREYEYLTYARLLLAEERLPAAEQLLAQLAAAMQAGPRAARLITVRLLQARLALQRHDEAAARTQLAAAVRLAAPGGYLRRFLDEGAPIAELLAHYDDPAHAAFVARLRAAVAPAEPTAASDALVEPLSEQELNVLHLLAEGCSNQQIAERLVITVGTAKWHVHNLYGKLGISGRLQAVARARELGLV